MPRRPTIRPYILMTCTALGCAAAPSTTAHADTLDIPTGAKRSPLLNGATPFSQKLLLYEEMGLQTLPQHPTDARLPAPDSGLRLPPPGDCASAPDSNALDDFLRQPLSPAPRESANEEDPNPWRGTIAACIGGLTRSPIEGRPPGTHFAHQRYDEFKPEVYFQTATTGARVNRGMRDGLQLHRYATGTEFGPGGLYYEITADPSGPRGTTRGVSPRLHPRLPVQNSNSVWTFDGTFPAKLVMARYDKPILFRHYNALPIDKSANNGFGAHEMSTHFHNGHSPGESDGFPGAYFFPGQYYDYRWPLILAGHGRINPGAQDPKAATLDDLGGLIKIPGNYRETLSTLWFHDHRSEHTSENTYKGMAAMVNLYGGIDRGREGKDCHYAAPTTNINLCFPSGTYLPWGNRDYDINLSIADKAWDATGQLYFNIFNTDGFLGDRMTVNWTWQPYLDVRPRRYRFRLLNASVARFYKIALVTAAGKRVPFHMIANDGNIMLHAVRFPNAESQDLPLQSIGERFDIIVDFAGLAPGTRLYFVNLAEHKDGSKPEQFATLAAALAGQSPDPAVGKFLELRVAAAIPGAVDRSMNPDDYVAGKMVMLPLPDFSPTELRTARRRTFVFGTDNGTDDKPWTIKTDDGIGRSEDLHDVLAVPKSGAVEVWTFKGGKGWTHPVHAHFTEGRILSRDGAPPPVWERFARKDMYNLGRLASGEIEIAMRFEDFLGTYVQHCHNTTHEDKAMLLRFDVQNPDRPMLVQAPLPTWGGVWYADSYIIND